MIAGGRKAGRALAQRLAIRQHVILGGHVHVAAIDGLWCVTGTPEQVDRIGVLWEKIRQPCPDRRPPRSRGIYRQVEEERRNVIYDEIAQWTADS